MSNEEIKDVAVREEDKRLPAEQNMADVVVHQGNIVSEDPFQMTIEEAKRQIGKQLELYELARTVASQLLTADDKYYMSQLSNKDWKRPKDGEKPVLKKQAVDKLLGFFKLGIFPDIKKIDGGYEVTIVGRDRNGDYIGTGKGICTRYEKKFAWIKASDEEYDVAKEEDRRIITKQYSNKSYKKKQIKTDERGMAHTLTSMAEKRARAAFTRKLMPVLDDVTFEGEAYESDFQYENERSVPSEMDQEMSESGVTEFYEKKKDKYTVKQIKEAFKEITKSDMIGGITRGQAADINTYLKDNFGDSS